GQRALQLMPRINERAFRMNHRHTGATSAPGRSLREPLQPAVFHREYAQAVAAKIRSEQMAATRVEEQAMGMCRTLQLRIAPTAGVLENTGRLTQVAIFRHGKDVVNATPVSRHREQ